MQQELYHEIFGSILDRREMTPYLLHDCAHYEDALNQASRMLANRGFDVVGTVLSDTEKARGMEYVSLAVDYLLKWLFPFVRHQLDLLRALKSDLHELYGDCSAAINTIEGVLCDDTFNRLITSDPRHLFLLASSAKYPRLFEGLKGCPVPVPKVWQRIGCGTLKLCHLIKSIEEDSQDINDFARLGFFLQSKGLSLENLFEYNWHAPEELPTEDSARRAFVKVATFFMKLEASLYRDEKDGALAFVFGEGIFVPIVRIRARLKSPESMFTKLGKSVENEVFGIRDILAITFIIEDKTDALILFHALQKRGVIMQEYTVSPSITQTLFDSPEEMHGAVRRLMVSLARSSGEDAAPDENSIRENAVQFFNALNVSRIKNDYSAGGHRKFQCKINYPLPVHREVDSNVILVPGTEAYEKRHTKKLTTKQHILPVELRISDLQSWEESEQHGEAHHDAYKCRQLLSVMARLFSPLFPFEEKNMDSPEKGPEASLSMIQRRGEYIHNRPSRTHRASPAFSSGFRKRTAKSTKNTNGTKKASHFTVAWAARTM